MCFVAPLESRIENKIHVPVYERAKGVVGDCTRPLGQPVGDVFQTEPVKIGTCRCL